LSNCNNLNLNPAVNWFSSIFALSHSLSLSSSFSDRSSLLSLILFLPPFLSISPPHPHLTCLCLLSGHHLSSAGNQSRPQNLSPCHLPGLAPSPSPPFQRPAVPSSPSHTLRTHHVRGKSSPIRRPRSSRCQGPDCYPSSPARHRSAAFSQTHLASRPLHCVSPPPLIQSCLLTASGSG
jgi:hypothetical protein